MSKLHREVKLKNWNISMLDGGGNEGNGRRERERESGVLLDIKHRLLQSH